MHREAVDHLWPGQRDRVGTRSEDGLFFCAGKGGECAGFVGIEESQVGAHASGAVDPRQDEPRRASVEEGSASIMYC